jgi:hypothetical protein
LDTTALRERRDRDFTDEDRARTGWAGVEVE